MKPIGMTKNLVIRNSKCFNDQDIIKIIDSKIADLKQEPSTSNNILTLDETVSQNSSSDNQEEIPISEAELFIQKLYQPERQNKNYYPKPSPPDLQYEEPTPYRAYTGNACYQWNIDGLANY